ncbi:MAG: molybdenum cofactor guanylyltransferase [Syntrophomonadaceae bacterium]|nr:molybdenum cofactor guanylyltransferase [Syntrophomonadaceae bacterium]MDD3022693.1 molybdenum cofactor guanylyltransferase [Syntrophomonadaceae bacterium]
MKASGVILAGGKSSRMQFNKAFARITAETVIEILVKKFRVHFDETIIISNDPELYSEFGVNVYTDIFARLGPVAGIHSALSHANNDAVFLLGCDMPFINMATVDYMLEKLNGHDTVVPEIKAHIQPTAAVYHRKSLPIFSRHLEENKLKLIWIFNELDALVLNESQLKQFGQIEDIFFNINDQEALEKARTMAGRLL